ncbi:MAG: aldehyde dehydrogenase family protein [Candidatus Diapherotrites archaeon]
MNQHGLFIGGKWLRSESGKTFKDINPANKKLVGVFQSGNAADVKKAVDAAEKAFPNWSSVPAPKRGRILLRFAELLKLEKEALSRLLTQENGKVLEEARGEVQEAIDTAEYFAGEGRRLFGHTTTSELQDKFCMTVRRPIGVCGLITPWNFPIALPAWKIMPALVCGNTVVLKPASDAPLCAIRFVGLLSKAGIPKGVVNLVTGSGSEVGMPLVKNKKVRAVSFTGSKETGERILSAAGVKRLGLELGGKNAIIVMDDADLKLALDGVIWGAFGTSGQRCTAASRVIMHKKISKKFTQMLLKRVKRLRLGNGLNAKTDAGPLINEAAVKKCAKYVSIGKEEGAKLLCGGKDAVRLGGFFFTPTIFSKVGTSMKIAREEIFGPVLSLLDARSLDDAIAKANSVEYGLSSAIYTKDIRSAFKAIEGIEAGITYINSSTIGSEVHLPFGGVKGTGNGAREAGIHGIEEFSEVKSVYVDFSGKLQRAQIDV